MQNLGVDVPKCIMGDSKVENKLVPRVLSYSTPVARERGPWKRGRVKNTMRAPSGVTIIPYADNTRFCIVYFYFFWNEIDYSQLDVKYKQQCSNWLL